MDANEMLRVQDAVLILSRHAGCQKLTLEEKLVPEARSGTRQLEGPGEILPGPLYRQSRWRSPVPCTVSFW